MIDENSALLSVFNMETEKWDRIPMKDALCLSDTENLAKEFFDRHEKWLPNFLKKKGFIGMYYDENGKRLSLKYGIHSFIRQK